MKKVSSSHYFISNSNFQAKTMSDTVHCHQNILLWSCTISNWSRSRKFHKSPKQPLSSGILSLCWHPCQVWISFHLKNDSTSHCFSTKEFSCCKAEHICPVTSPGGISAVRRDEVIQLGLWDGADCRAGVCAVSCTALCPFVRDISACDKNRQVPPGR